MRDIVEAIKGYVPKGGNQSLNLWELWQDTRVLPFAGGWLDQPAWVLDDFNYFDLLHEWHYYNAKLSDATGLPTFNQL